jgi:truncated hemoglobin YjbI
MDDDELITFDDQQPTMNTCQRSLKCPFEPRNGYSTEQGRREYLKSHQVSDVSKAHSLYADPDQSQPLYYWQLYSLLGQRHIFELVTDFYTRIYADDEAEFEWFRKAFTDLGSKEHHIQAQAAYWIDTMGGGRVYHGGLYRLNVHHQMNAGHVMNAEGACRWMYHMRKTLVHYDFAELGQQQQDARILPCMVDFLKTKMQSYAKEHMWEFDERDFEFTTADRSGDYEGEEVRVEKQEETLHAITEEDDNKGDEEKTE